MYAALADQHEMELLNLAHSTAVRRTECTALLDTGEVLKFSLAVYCGEWYRLGMLWKGRSDAYG